MLLEPRPFRPFKTSEEYLYAMKEDLAEWLNNLYNLDINVDNFFERLDTGEVLCAVSSPLSSVVTACTHFYCKTPTVMMRTFSGI